MSKNLEQDRIQAIDFVKGIDIIFMVLFNYSITLDYFNLMIIPSNYLYRYILPVSIASIFIFISGVTAYISYQKQKEKLTRKYLIRGMKLLFLCSINNIIHLCFCTPEYNILRDTAFLCCCLFSHTGFHKV